mmetsp:Transcript_118326/g.230185  ORF Transcript_118326/g.230185 Transcript_118326/m.230185 type:complete len:182 (+) Transcript_118326:93-638(+)
MVVVTVRAMSGEIMFGPCDVGTGTLASSVSATILASAVEDTSGSLAWGSRTLLPDDVIDDLAVQEEDLELTWIATCAFPSGNFSASEFHGVPTYGIGSSYQWTLHIDDMGIANMKYEERHDCGWGSDTFVGTATWHDTDLLISLEVKGGTTLFHAQVMDAGSVILMKSAPNKFGSLKLIKQ